jgi:monoamine oxidase
MPQDPDVIVIGAGAAGITAAVALAETGLRVTILEARDRIGGRIFTVHDSSCNAPVELGAEFIHGRPPEIWNLLQSHKIRVTEVDGDTWCSTNGKLAHCDFFPEVDKILEKMDDRKPDQSFESFLKSFGGRSKNDSQSEEAKKWASGYVSGFNAADPALVGVHWLVKEMRAEEKIQADRIFHSEHGYADLLGIFQKQLTANNVAVQKSTVVNNIKWRRGKAEITVQGSNGETSLLAPRVLITVPLGVLQAASGEEGAISFTPKLPEKTRKAIRDIAMGKVIRVTLRFRERFWDELPKDRKKGSKSMAGLSFLLSHDEWFPTWWTVSRDLPFLIGWAPFRCAERLSSQSESFVTDHAIQALHRLTGMPAQELEALLEQVYCHDWQADPFSRGAYSYGIVGGDGAELALARPVENTLFFAGEATDTTGNTGTVHAAVASGNRAAREIMESLPGRKILGSKSKS